MGQGKFEGASSYGAEYIKREGQAKGEKFRPQNNLNVESHARFEGASSYGAEFDQEAQVRRYLSKKAK